MDYLAQPASALIRNRSPFVVVDCGTLRVLDHCLALDRAGECLEIPLAMVAAILIEPGVTVTHEAVKLAAECQTLLIWCGEAGVRVYSAGMPGGASGQQILFQACIHSDSAKRLAAAFRVYELMFGVPPPPTRSIEKLRGYEGARVKRMLSDLAAEHGVPWSGKEQSPKALQSAMGFATSCLYGLSEAVVLASGYSPAIGIVHSGNERSLVFDLADTVKFTTVVPLAFATYCVSAEDIPGRIRRRCRDLFREVGMAEQLFDNLRYIMTGDADRSFSR